MVNGKNSPPDSCPTHLMNRIKKSGEIGVQKSGKSRSRPKKKWATKL